MLTAKLRSKRLSHSLLIACLGLLLICIALFFWQLDSYSLFNITEAKQAEIARQMWVRHDWITPIYNGDVYYDKPVLLHWLIAIGFPLWGMSEWAVRLPSAIAATALILTTWLFTAHFTNRRTAWFAATMLAANPFTFAVGRTGQHDMLLAWFMSAALYCWFLGYSTGKRSGYLAFFALLALAVLSKGPLALVLCGLTIALFLLWVGQWQQQLKTMPWKWGMLLFLGIAVPWYALVILTNGREFVHQSFLYNNVDRFFAANLNQEGPWWYYFPLAIVGFFPWLALAPSALRHFPLRQAMRMRYWRQRPAHDQLRLFMVIWFLAVFGFMSMAATKLPWYIYPGFPALAYLCAIAWDQQIASTDRWLQWELRLISVLYGAVGIALALLPKLLPDAEVVQLIAEMGTLTLWAGLHLMAAVGIWFSAIRWRLVWVWLIAVITFGLFALTTINQVLPTLDRQAMGARLMPIVEALQRETCENCSNDVIAALGVNDPSLNFYSGFSYIKRFEAPYELWLQLQQPQRLLLVTKDSALDRMGVNLSCYAPAYVADVFKLFIIPPNSQAALSQCVLPGSNGSR